MKSITHIFLGGSAVLAVVIGLLVWYNQQEAVQPTLPATPQPVVVTATPILAQVFLATADTTFSEIKTATQVVSGSRLKTSATGRAIIEGKTATVLDASSELTIAFLDAEKNQSAFQLQLGGLWARVQKLSDKGEYYEIETHNAHASVRGTAFGLSQDTKSTTLIVTEGVVRFGPKLGPFAMVPAGKKAIVVGSLPAVVSDISVAEKQQAQLIENNFKQVVVEPSPESIEPVVANELVVEPPRIAEPELNPEPIVAAKPKIILNSISPQLVVEGKTASIKLMGEHFITADVVSVTVGTTKIAKFSVIDNNTIFFTLDSRLFQHGSYDVTIEDAAGARSMIRSGIAVTQAPTPIPTTSR